MRWRGRSLLRALHFDVCVVSVRWRITKTHATDEGWGDLLGVEQRFVGGDIQMQIGLMNPAKHAEIGTQRRARSLARVAMHFANAVSIVIARPLMRTVADHPMLRMTPRIAVRLIGVQHRATKRDIFVNQFVAGPLIGVVTDPETMLATLA